MDWITATPRRSGRTTRALMDSPRGAYYVCPTVAAVSYTRALALSLNRDDLKIVPPSWLRPQNILSTSKIYVTIDHATMLDTELPEPPHA